jgi:hypothetical protein
MEFPLKPESKQGRRSSSTILFELLEESALNPYADWISRLEPSLDVGSEQGRVKHQIEETRAELRSRGARHDRFKIITIMDSRTKSRCLSIL